MVPVDNQPDILSNVAAVVVLYYPDSDVYMNIASYLDQVDLVILVDNSDDPAFELIERLAHNTKVLPIINNCNLGIASALNIGAREAISKGYSFLLTMDQDSFATPGMVDTLKEYYDGQEGQQVSIVSPFHLTTINGIPDSGLTTFEEVETVWTSGNLLRLSAYQSVGPFEEDLFIDFVDHEYCLRLKRYGYRIIQSNKAILHHNIGNNLRKVCVLSAPLIVSNHSPLRRYYITRNRFWVANKYREFKKFCRIDRRRFFAELVTILLFEDQKIEKFKMIVRGYRDYIAGKMGKLKCIRLRKKDT
ncbi:MAG: glycosyltransferase family 2 protein [Geobacter sp.]|nr:MAG: glycosyltransferase family 2 protein [Geobacter sp.]